jgi:hypothetical protein
MHSLNIAMMQLYLANKAKITNSIKKNHDHSIEGNGNSAQTVFTSFF